MIEIMKKTLKIVKMKNAKSLVSQGFKILRAVQILKPLNIESTEKPVFKIFSIFQNVKDVPNFERHQLSE